MFKKSVNDQNQRSISWYEEAERRGYEFKISDYVHLDNLKRMISRSPLVAMLQNAGYV